MKKIFLGSLLLTALFTACTSDDDYNSGIASPQASDPTITHSFGNGSITEVGVINLADVADETVKVAEIVAPQPTSKTATLDSMFITFINENGEDVVMKIKEDGLVPTADFASNVVEGFYGKRPVEREMKANLTAYLTDKTQVFQIVSKEFSVKAIPEAPHISENYYIVGGPNEWTDAPLKQIKFNHSDKDVYEDPVFTVVFDAAASGDTWFAIGDDEACEAIPGDWSKLLGIVGGDNYSTEGRLDVRSNMGAENSFCVAAGAKKIKVTINMMEYSFKVEPVSIADAYYLVGGPGSWSSDKSQKFSHSSADVFEDPVFSYVFAGNGGTGDIWFAFGDADALDAIDNNDWMQLYGYKGDFGMSGSFERRSVLGGENTFHVDGTAKFYRFTVNMAEMTYEIVELNFTEYIYTVGNVNGTGWDKAFPLYGPDYDGKYQGSYYLGSEFKFKPNADNWDGDWGQNPNGESGKLVQEGESNCKTTAEGFYMIDVNLATMEYTLTPITKVCMVGGAVGDDWDNGVEMTYNTTKNCWECDATFTKADVIKFKGNGTWDTFDGNWGGTMDNIINGSNDNIPVTLSGDVHVEFYPSCNTRSYCTITQR